MQSNVYHAAMKYGLLMGVLFSVNFLFSISTTPFVALLSYLLIAFILVLTYRFAVAYRDKDNGGTCTFGQAFFFIFLLYLFAAIISSVVKYVYFKFIDVNYLSELLNKSSAIMQQIQEQFKLEVPDDYYDSMEKMMNPAMYTLQFIWVNAILGGLVGLIMAPFVKKSKSIFDKNDETPN